LIIPRNLKTGTAVARSNYGQAIFINAVINCEKNKFLSTIKEVVEFFRDWAMDMAERLVDK
jgi:hypothetical protein